VRLHGWLWIRLLLLLAWLRLYVAVRRLLIWARIPADLLTECGDHDGRMTFRDLPVNGIRPGTLND
jgi:hypothetical protein